MKVYDLLVKLMIFFVGLSGIGYIVAVLYVGFVK